MTGPAAAHDGRRLTETAVAGLGWTSLAVALQALVQMLALIVLARFLAPGQFGLFAAALVIGGFCAIFVELGVGPAIVQRPAIGPRHVRSGFTFSVGMSLAAGLALFLAAEAVAGFFRMPELADVVRLMALGFPLQGLATVAQALALRGLRFRWLATLDAAALGLGYLVVAPALTVLGFGVHALVAAFLAQHALRAVVLLAGQPHAKRPSLDPGALGELLYFGAGFTLARIGNTFATQADNLVVGRWLGAAALGLYGHAYQLMASPAMLLGQLLDRVLFPTMARVQDQPERLVRAYRGGVFACAVTILPASVLIAIVAPEIVRVLLGPAWAGVAAPLQILALGMLFRTSYKVSDTLVRATGAVYARAWRQAVFAAAVFLFAFAGQNWGLRGVATGVLLALGLNFAMMAHLAMRLIGMRPADFLRAHLPGLALAAAVGASGLLAADALRGAGAPPAATAALVATGGMTLAGLLVWLRPRLFLGPDRAQVLRALLRVAPVRLHGGIVLLQRRAAG